MRQVIWKYPLEITDRQTVELPANARILSLQTQGEQPCIWVQIDLDATQNEVRRIAMFGTGHMLPDEPLQFIGTVQCKHALVFHVYEQL